LDSRLQDRYVKLVKSHSGVSQSLASGVRAVAEASSAFACTRAASRFFHNKRITLRDLAEPLIAFARDEVSRTCDGYVLIAHDWSPLSFNKHHRKKDRIGLSQSRIPEGYEVQSALALSDRDGLPLAPLAMSLRAADGVHCSRLDRVREPLSQLDELDPAMSYVERQQLGLPTVHVIDAEADSVAHYREWSARPDRVYLVRSDDRLVEHEGCERKCSLIQQELRASGGFHYSRNVFYKGKKAQQFVAEVPVRLLRPGQRNRPQRGDRERVPGEPLPLRLVIAEVRSSDGQVLATWFLLSNVPAAVSPNTIALWYYWRWRIETFFKLLKSAGVQAEHWQQETADGIARRLLVACMACVVVWSLAHSEHPRAPEARRLLVRLSGRQMKHRVEYTLPAMLAGLWVLLAMLDALEQYSFDDLQTLSHVVFGQPP
jgi:hypothetical protein